MEMENKDFLEILFIRHAETDYDDWEGRDPSDGELTPKGERQCNELGEKLRDVEIDAYISSSLLRAFKTAVGVCKAKGDNPVIEICPEIIECGCTPGYFGCSEEYLNKYYKNTRMCRNLFGEEEYKFPCVSYEENCARARKFIEYICSNFGCGKRVAVFSHHGMLEYLIPTALGVEPHKFLFALDNVSVTAVDICADDKRVLRYVNK